MIVEDIKAEVLRLPEITAWPEMIDVFDRSVHRPNQVWEWPWRTCQAVGGDETLIAPGSAAILCMILSILFVDDMLDEDPRGIHLQLGDAAAANLSFAFQAAAFRVIANARVDAGVRAAVMDSLAQMALTIAYGQDLDSQNLSGEENYWKVTRAKSSSYFGTAMHIGALLGKAPPEVAERLRCLGAMTGEVIQIHDDIKDALATPANPDWKLKRNNLLFLYALTADHPERDRFSLLQSQVDDPKALREAQKILIRCGAVSYALYHICKRYQAGRNILEGTALSDPVPLQTVLVQYIQPVVELLTNLGIAVPSEIATA